MQIEDAGEAQAQFAALCWRMKAGRVQVLLITSRDTGRWIIPKGWPVKGLDPKGSAAQEAWEEAGVKGDVLPEHLGHYTYPKGISKNAVLPCIVSVFPLKVETLARDFPERGQRRRKWFSIEKAATKVSEPELRALMQSAPNVLKYLIKKA
jgi:8-oxo-dGTP pyrophosphatase MutT (NUDIX family)